MSDIFENGSDAGTALSTFCQELSALDDVLHMSRQAWWGAQAGHRLLNARATLAWNEGAGHFYGAMRHHCLPGALYVEEERLVWEALDQKVRGALVYYLSSLKDIRAGHALEMGKAEAEKDTALRYASALMDDALGTYDFVCSAGMLGHAGNGIVTECRDMEVTLLAFSKAEEDGYLKGPAAYLKRGEKKRLARVFGGYDDYWRMSDTLGRTGRFMPSTGLTLFGH